MNPGIGNGGFMSGIDTVSVRTPPFVEGEQLIFYVLKSISEQAAYWSIAKARQIAQDIGYA